LPCLTTSHSVIECVGVFDRILLDILREIMLINVAELGPVGKRYQRLGYQEFSREKITNDLELVHLEKYSKTT
jgi:hypothetical protein